MPVLRSMVPTTVKAIVPADRGFGRTALATFCRRRHGFGYPIRVGPKVTVRPKGFYGRRPDYPVKPGVAKVLRDVRCRADGAVAQHVVVRWKPGLPERRDECWFLMTDLKGTAHQLCALYARRMTIEQRFRDGKSKRNGWSLRDTQLGTPDRPDRLLLVLSMRNTNGHESDESARSVCGRDAASWRFVRFVLIRVPQ